MRETGTLVLGALCVLVTVAASAQQPPAPAPTGTARVRGLVINGATGTPLRGAEVQLSGDTFRQAETDETGRFEVANLPAGRYTIRATKGGYAPPGASTFTADPGRAFTLVDGQTLNRDVTLLSGGVITGRVYDESGDPVTGLEVRVERYTYGPAGRQLATASSGAGIPFNQRTDDLGEFRVFGLAPGEYIVSTRSQQFGAPLTRGAAGARDRSEGYPPTFYPGTTRQADAQGVRVRAGQETAVNISVTAGRMLRVSGKASNSRGLPATGLNVYLGVQTSNSSGQLDGGPVGPDGSFSIGNVPAGEYVLRVRQAGATGPGTEIASMPIAVSTDDLTGLDIVTRPGTNIAGRVEWDGAAPRPTTPIRVRTRSAIQTGNGPIESESTITYVDQQSGTVLEDDTFVLGGIVGTVLFAANPTQSWTLKSASLNGKDITDIGMEAAGLGGESRVVIVMTDRTTTVNGTARGTGAQAIADYAVVLLSQQPVPGAAASRYTRFIRPDEAGAFTVRGLPIGDYVAAAAESLEIGSEWDPAVQTRVRSSGQRFSLADGDTLTLTLDVLR